MKIYPMFVVTHLFAILLLASCTGTPGDGSNSSNKTGPKITIQKNEGINVNESDAIWITGMKIFDGTARTVKIHRMELKSELNYPVTTSDLALPGAKGEAGSGIRTYVTEDGLLIGKTGGTEVGLYLARNQGGVSAIWEPPAGNILNGSRATPFAYRITRDGTNHDYIAIAIKEPSAGWYRIHRFRKQGNSFVPLRALRINHANANEALGVYTGYLNPCGIKIQGECAPRFWGGRNSDFFGANLVVDVPGTPDDGQTITVPHIDAPNKAFTSASHPVGGQVGTVNDSVYSMSGDEEGNHFLAYFPDTGSGNNFTSYDKVNQVVYLATRTTELEPDGTRANQKKPALYVFKRSCFISTPNCDPLALKPATVNARVFRDVGLEPGPTSDLGNGCVAVLSFKRPGEPDGNVYFTKVYRACIRDGEDLDKGMTVSLLGEVEGAAYMYNDFTGATLFDRPIYLLFDFAKRGVSSIKSASYYWTPRFGFSSTPIGLLAAVRCYKSGQKPNNDDGFTTFNLGNGIAQHEIPGCKGEGINQVEFKLERNPNVATRFTRFQNFSVSVEK